MTHMQAVSAYQSNILTLSPSILKSLASTGFFAFFFVAFFLVVPSESGSEWIEFFSPFKSQNNSIPVQCSFCPLSEVIFYRVCIQEYFRLVL